MGTHAIRHFLSVFFWLALAAALPAAPVTLTIKDWTGRGFAPDLVSYTIDLPADGGKALRVLEADGASLPVQVTPGEQGKATLSFVASVPPNGSATYTVRTDGQGPAATPAVSSTRDGDALVLANQLLAVKVPAPREKTFDQPVAANTLPAPMLAFRGANAPSTGLGAGAWHGAGVLLLKRPVKKFSVTQTADGPVYSEIRYRLDYAGGGYYQAVVRVTDRAPFALVREEFDLGVDADTDFWQLDSRERLAAGRLRAHVGRRAGYVTRGLSEPGSGCADGHLRSHGRLGLSRRCG